MHSLVFLKKLGSNFFKFLLILISLLCLVNCSPHSFEDFREEGEGITRSLIQDLQAIHTREQLIAASSRLQNHFENLVTVMIAAEEFSIKNHHLEKEELSAANHELSDQLRIELNRIYRLEGGKQIIEKIQQNALQRLSAFNK